MFLNKMSLVLLVAILGTSWVRASPVDSGCGRRCNNTNPAGSLQAAFIEQQENHFDHIPNGGISIGAKIDQKTNNFGDPGKSGVQWIGAYIKQDVNYFGSGQQSREGQGFNQENSPRCNGKSVNVQTDQSYNCGISPTVSVPSGPQHGYPSNQSASDQSRKESQENKKSVNGQTDHAPHGQANYPLNGYGHPSPISLPGGPQNGYGNPSFPGGPQNGYPSNQNASEQFEKKGHENGTKVNGQADNLQHENGHPPPNVIPGGPQNSYGNPRPAGLPGGLQNGYGNPPPVTLPGGPQNGYGNPPPSKLPVRFQNGYGNPPPSTLSGGPQIGYGNPPPSTILGGPQNGFGNPPPSTLPGGPQNGYGNHLPSTLPGGPQYGYPPYGYRLIGYLPNGNGHTVQEWRDQEYKETLSGRGNYRQNGYGNAPFPGGPQNGYPSKQNASEQFELKGHENGTKVNGQADNLQHENGHPLPNVIPGGQQNGYGNPRPAGLTGGPQNGYGNLPPSTLPGGPQNGYGNLPPSTLPGGPQNGYGNPPPSTLPGGPQNGYRNPPPSTLPGGSQTGYGNPPPSTLPGGPQNGYGNPPPSTLPGGSQTGYGNPPPSTLPGVPQNGYGNPLPPTLPGGPQYGYPPYGYRLIGYLPNGNDHTVQEWRDQEYKETLSGRGNYRQNGYGNAPFTGGPQNGYPSKQNAFEQFEIKGHENGTKVNGQADNLQHENGHPLPNVIPGGQQNAYGNPRPAGLPGGPQNGYGNLPPSTLPGGPQNGYGNPPPSTLPGGPQNGYRNPPPSTLPGGSQTGYGNPPPSMLPGGPQNGYGNPLPPTLPGGPQYGYPPYGYRLIGYLPNGNGHTVQEWRDQEYKETLRGRGNYPQNGYENLPSPPSPGGPQYGYPSYGYRPIGNLTNSNGYTVQEWRDQENRETLSGQANYLQNGYGNALPVPLPVSTPHGYPLPEYSYGQYTDGFLSYPILAYGNPPYGYPPYVYPPTERCTCGTKDNSVDVGKVVKAPTPTLPGPTDENTESSRHESPPSNSDTNAASVNSKTSLKTVPADKNSNILGVTSSNGAEPQQRVSQ